MRGVGSNEHLRASPIIVSFRPRACAPYRARTKGRDERGVRSVKHNAIARHGFLPGEAHLKPILPAGRRDRRNAGPIERFRHAEAAALRPLNGRA
jgi:transposase